MEWLYPSHTPRTSLRFPRGFFEGIEMSKYISFVPGETIERKARILFPDIPNLQMAFMAGYQEAQEEKEITDE